MSLRMRFALGTIAAVAILAFSLGSAGRLTAKVALPTPPPPAPVKPVTDTYFGTTVVDRYRYMENMKAPEVQAFFKNQNDYTRRILALLGAPRERLLKRIAQLDNAGTAVSSVTLDGDYYFYLKLAPNANNEKLYMRGVASDAPEKLLVDPSLLAKSPKEHFTINYFLPSLDGHYVAYGISEGGSENAVLHVIDTTTGVTLPDSIDRCKYVGATSWLPDNSFYYVRFPKLAPNADPATSELKPVAYLHVLGRDPDADPAVFGIGVNPDVKFTPIDFPIVLRTPVSPYVIGLVQHGVQNEGTLYVVNADAITGPSTPWKKLLDVDSDVTQFDLRGSTIYLLTHKDALSYKVTSMRLDDPTKTQTLVPESKAVVEQISVANDGLYVRARTGGFGNIVRIGLSADGTPDIASKAKVPLPYPGTIDLLATDARVDGATFGLTAWTKSLLYYKGAPGVKPVDTKLKPLSPVDESGYESREVQARSEDGTMIPLSIVLKRGLKLDGTHPTYLEAYGAYGITLSPGFSTTRVAWMERGGVFAICHVRGGGWFGEAWHKAGMLATKRHSIEDFAACARYLIARHYTAASHLGGSGTSAGGIVIDGAITQYSNLLAAAIDEVGASNALRQEFSPNGPPNVPEFGSVKTKAGFEALLVQDAYEHVRDGAKYPAVMLVTGINDPRVSPWELAKFAARLQAANTSGRPTLLRVDYDSGHGFLAASRAQTDQLLTDEYSFLLWQLGDPEFQTIPMYVR
jgi:prolyl oligopeptidase